MIHIVLLEPEIPSNTGNIARTCAATGSGLHLIKPLGFSISDRELKRAGLDYWHMLDVRVYENIADFRDQNPDARAWYSSTKAALCYADARYHDGDFIFFGRETKGLPEELILDNIDRALRIPMMDGARSLNLSNSVAVILYESLRQLGFAGLAAKGKFAENKRVLW